MSNDLGTTIGKLADDGAGRDAIHVAVAPMIATERLWPGQHVGVIGDRAGVREPFVGIVDPFLAGAVQEGQRFWLFLYPNTVTLLRHQWTHPAFSDAAPAQSSSEAWLRLHAEAIGLSYGRLIELANEWLQYGEYHTLSYDTPDVVYEDNEKFWTHFEVVTGKKVDADKRQTFISCSC